MPTKYAFFLTCLILAIGLMGALYFHNINSPLKSNSNNINKGGTASSISAEQPNTFKTKSINKTTPDSQHAKEYMVQPENIPDPNPDFKNLQERLNTMSSRRDGLTFDASEVQKAVQHTSMWTLRNEPPKNTPLDPNELTDGRPFFDVNPLKIETLMPGDTFEVFIPQNSSTLTLHVEHVKKRNNTLTWKGSVNIDNTISLFTMSKGHSYVNGAIEANNIHYTFEVHGSVGWIEESSKLFTGEGEPVIPTTNQYKEQN